METAISEETIITDKAFDLLQQRLADRFSDIFYNDMAEKSVVIIPSLTLDEEILQTVKGVAHYEERMLSMLMLLRMPRTHVIYVTSIPIDSTIIDYYLHLLPGITGYHATQRLTMLSCYDASSKSLTEKILARPRLIKRIREQIKFQPMSHLACFNVTEHEKKLALDLDIPIFGCDPKLLPLGTKSGGRRLFKKVGVPTPDGMEDLKDENEIAAALADLKKNNPGLKKAVVKMNDGFSGEGNAIFYYKDLDPASAQFENTIRARLQLQLKVVASNLDYKTFMEKFRLMGGIVEIFLEGDIKESPSVQCRVNPIGDTEVLSTHNQLMDGESDQVFLGATFPANSEYCNEISEMGKAIADEMKKEGVWGRFSVDFISVKEDNNWKHYAIEINLRKGGTTHPFILLQFLTGGKYEWKSGIFKMPNGQTSCYFSSDNVVNEKYKGLTPHDLIDIAMCNRIQYDGARQSGVMFHMIGALSQFGKLGLVCIGRTIEEAKDYYNKTLEVLDKECSV